MSKPIKVEDRSSRLTSAWLAFKEECVSKRVSLDRYRHFGIVVNWRCAWALVQAVLAFEMWLAIVFAGRGWSLFGRLFENEVVPLIDNQVIWASFCLIAAITGYGLWHNRRWAFLAESLLIAMLFAGITVVFWQHKWQIDNIVAYFWTAMVAVQIIAFPYQLYKRYRDYDSLNNSQELDQENPIPAKNS